MPLNPFAFAFAVFSVLSAASIVLAGAIAWRLIARRDRIPSMPFLFAIVVIEVPLLALSGGLTVFDPYSYGYHGLVVPVLMVALVVIGWMLRAPEIAIWIGLAALLHVLDAYGSRNIWDYLVDPVAGLAAIMWLAGGAVKRWRGYRANPENSATTRS